MPPAASPTATWDHPRSRGVYQERGEGHQFPAGSSPLARGLHRGVGARPSERRIIPARAGFTRCDTSPMRPRSDHPRSRGVYSQGMLVMPLSLGSSPLARGLRVTSRNDYLEGRIIPARAGFTSRLCRWCVPWADHPRSRGVYRWWTKEPPGDAGSSPLARGLPGRRDRGRLRLGIIPARAGFTSSACRSPT